MFEEILICDDLLSTARSEGLIILKPPNKRDKKYGLKYLRKIISMLYCQMEK